MPTLIRMFSACTAAGAKRSVTSLAICSAVSADVITIVAAKMHAAIALHLMDPLRLEAEVNRSGVGKDRGGLCVIPYDGRVFGKEF